MARTAWLALLLILPWSLTGGDVPGAKPEAPLFSDAEWGAQKPAPGAESATLGRAAIGLIGSLVVIVGGAAGLAWAFKRFNVRKVLPGRGRHLEVIETVPLGFKRAVSLVRIGDHLLVVGQGEHELHHLATLPASALTSAPASASAAAAPQPADVPAAPPTAPPPVNDEFRRLLEQVAPVKR